MKKLIEIDKNMLSPFGIDAEDVKYFDVNEAPIDLYGVKYDNDSKKFVRMPTKIAKQVSENVEALNFHTSGGRLRFVTDSPFITLTANLPQIEEGTNMPLTGKCGFDVYVKRNGKYQMEWIFYPNSSSQNLLSSMRYFPEDEGVEKDILINLPLYTSVKDIQIGIKKECFLKKAPKYKTESRVVFYGSSITQGGCVNHPGNAYPAILSRKYDFDFLNLGFSGSALAEDIMIDYIKNLDMSIFVLDYDHNAPDEQHLKNTHLKFYKSVRQANPDLPIVIVTSPFGIYDLDGRRKARKQVIIDTYNYAVANGDKNVFLIDEENYADDYGYDYALSDMVHPNDLGHFLIAKSMFKTFENIENKKQMLK